MLSACLQLGVFVEEADQLALQEAVALRRSLVTSGQATQPHKAQLKSGVKGVIWVARYKCWRVHTELPKKKADGKRRRVQKNFYPKNASAGALTIIS